MIDSVPLRCAVATIHKIEEPVYKIEDGGGYERVRVAVPEDACMHAYACMHACYYCMHA